jgi:mannose-1-phosphate guanylyltransferase
VDIQNKVAVIFAGGSGKRLCPLSVAKVPKQINPTLSKELMLVEAYTRASRAFDKKILLLLQQNSCSKQQKNFCP